MTEIQNGPIWKLKVFTPGIRGSLNCGSSSTFIAQVGLPQNAQCGVDAATESSANATRKKALWDGPIQTVEAGLLPYNGQELGV